MEMPEQSGIKRVVEQQQPRQEPEPDPEPYNTSLLTVNSELRFKRQHDLVAKTLAKRGRRDSNGEEINGDELEQVPDGDENGELGDAQLRQAQRVAAARLEAATQIRDVIERICACDNLRMPDSPPK